MEDNKWISVKDKLPELKKFYWDEKDECYKSEVVITVIVYDPIDDMVYAETYSEGRGFNDNPDITHWQPLPSPPTTNLKQ